MNIIGIIGLIVAMCKFRRAQVKTRIAQIAGWYLTTLGFWSMLYAPIHFAVFLIISLLLPVLLYTAYTLHGLYLALGEAYIDVSVISCHVSLIL